MFFVDPYLDPNCLQRLSAEDESHCYQGKSSMTFFKALDVLIFPVLHFVNTTPLILVG